MNIELQTDDVNLPSNLNSNDIINDSHTEFNIINDFICDNGEIFEPNESIDLQSEELNADDIDSNVDSYIEKLNDLRRWAIQHQITHLALKDLLAILRSLGVEYLPKDSRTFLKTPTNVASTIVPMDQGESEYWHFGLQKCLENISDQLDVYNEISLVINMDGLPIHKSSKLEFWPILCRVYENIEIKPMTIGIYSGAGKPNDVNEFLTQFVDEMNYNLTNGVIVNGRRISIKIKCFVCDTVSRVFIKGFF